NNFSMRSFPNPTSGSTSLNYTIPEPGMYSLKITNSIGIESARIFTNQLHAPGHYSINYNTGILVPGVYYLTIESGNLTETRNIVIVK
nr:T9SS type A sorting domain-containing protein [Candidatus Kapabacteria bacterium]